MPKLDAVPHPKPMTTPPPRAYFGGFTQPPPRAEIQRYMRGDCGYMAMALARLLPDSQLWQVGVGHFAVEDRQGQFWDIRGQMTLDQAWSGLAGPTMTPMTRDQVIAELDTGIYGNAYFTPSRETKARKLARALLPPQAMTKPGDASPETKTPAHARAHPFVGPWAADRGTGSPTPSDAIKPKAPRP